MGELVYRLVANDGSINQSRSESEIKNWKADMGGTITAYDMTFRVENDPVPQIYESGEQAYARVDELSGMYQAIPIHTMISPQPPGLN